MTATTLDAAQAAFDAIVTPALLAEAEVAARRMSYVSPEEMWRPFTI